MGVAPGAYDSEKHCDTNITGTGVGDAAHTTSGLHTSNWEDKLDPRVDGESSSGLGSITQG
jgi:hypothetical protein